MGLDANVFAWGPFAPEIASYLLYPAVFYSRTAPGTLVITELFDSFSGTGASKKLAACLGISNAWDFNQHKIDPEKIDAQALRALFKTLEYEEDNLKDLEALLALRAGGFQFVFRPNG
jgi:hypothetical protein